VCNDWFLDCYNNEAARPLREQVGRFTPFALQLARLVERQPVPLDTAAALSEFYKFRGFTAADRRQRADLYREALRYHPGNANVRQLLAEMEPETRP
jgi:hypothetical protein